MFPTLKNSLETPRFQGPSTQAWFFVRLGLNYAIEDPQSQSIDNLAE
jgi:hypothetical protein